MKKCKNPCYNQSYSAVGVALSGVSGSINSRNESLATRKVPVTMSFKVTVNVQHYANGDGLGKRLKKKQSKTKKVFPFENYRK